MHSHDRTLIARLGFDDPDKRNPRHDLACRYLAEDKVASRLINKYFRRLGEEEDKPYWPTTRNEEPLTKGSGQYEVVIGFLDVWYHLDEEKEPSWDFLIEVKCNSISSTEILRQIKFYRESIKNCPKFRFAYGRPPRSQAGESYDCWILVTDFEIMESEENMFLKEGIEVFRLGADFEAWLVEQGVS